MNRILVAGIGNVFFGDDAFGVAVARALTPTPGVTVTDFGIRALHFAFELTTPIDLCIIADCMPRGGEPGTLYVLEPDVDDDDTVGVASAHGMSLPSVFAAVRDLGGQLPPLLVVGCEPEQTEPGIGLSPAVERAIPTAADLIRELIASRRTHEEPP